MRRAALSILPLLFLACKDPEPQKAAVKVLVNFDDNFEKGCIKLQAQDEASSEVLEEDKVPTAGKSSPLTIAVIRKDGWGTQLRLVATAHESASCDGTAVDTQTLQVDLGQEGLRKDELAMRLATPDVDGDGYVARLQNGGGTDCDDSATTGAVRFPGNPEVCDGVDNNCDVELAVDEGFDKVWYRDADQDGSLSQSSRAVQCDSPGTDYVHLSTQTFDCDDGDADRTPGKTEVCDSKDNNCVNGVDEFFANKGQACNNDVCAGTFVCNSARDGTVCSAPAPVTYHPDVDRDGQGRSGSTGTKVCAPNAEPPGTVANATDCDDVDPSARMAQAEVCDAVDNNCDGQVDEGASCGFLSLVDDPARGGGGHDWRAVAVGQGGLPVWIAGLGGKLIVRKTAGGPFESFSFGMIPIEPNNCGDYDWYAAWVRPSDGVVFLAGENGQVAQHDGTACSNAADATGNGELTGIVGFESGGVTTLYLVSTEGRFFTWIPGSTPVERQDTGSVYNGIHGLNPDALLLVVGSNGGNQWITSKVNGNLTGNTAHTLSPVGSGQVNSVWMGTSSQAYAVGDGGRVWKWDGAMTWALQPAPPSGTANLTGVVTLPSGDAFMVDSSANGQLHRRTQFGWAAGPKLPAFVDKPMYGIAMVSERDFWVVGDDGYVFHYPEFP